MSRVSEILVRVRDSLSDDDKTRWSDARLIRLIDEAQKDMVQQAQMLRTKTDITVLANVSTYELPSDAYLLTRVVDDEGAKIDLLSHNDMDLLGSHSFDNSVYNRSYYSDVNSGSQVRKRWEAETGADIQYVIFDKQNPRSLKVYPIPVGDDEISDTYTPSDFGVAVEVEDDLMVSDFGVVASLSEGADESTTFSSVYGVLTGMQNVVSSLTLYYRRLPETISNVNSIPEIEPIWDKGIRYYTIAMALSDDQDTQNLAVADKFMGMYVRELDEAKATSSRNNISSSPRSAEYNRAI